MASLDEFSVFHPVVLALLYPRFAQSVRSRLNILSTRLHKLYKNLAALTVKAQLLGKQEYGLENWGICKHLGEGD